MAVGKMFWRTALQCWYCKVDGKMTCLAPDEAVARRRWEALLVEYGTKNPTTSDIVTLYLDWAETELAPTTYQRRKRPLQLLAKQFGRKAADVI